MEVETRELLVNGWRSQVCDHAFRLPSKLVRQALELLDAWVFAFVWEETWVRLELGIPSLIVRLDCVEDDRGDLGVYEVEERPAGIGVTSLIDPSFKNQLELVKASWPEFQVIISSQRSGSDDHLWAAIADDSEGLVMIRAEPEEEAFRRFERRSISSLTAKGDKSYGEKLGLWRRVSPAELDSMWESPFVLKPLKGSKTRGLEIWDPSHRKGSSTKTRVARVLGERGAMYCQPLLGPMPSRIEAFPMMIYRIFFGFSLESSQWICLGGVWNARNNLKIHGATDTIFGPLVLS